MYGSQEKILGQKVNVKFFTVDPYSVGTGVPPPCSRPPCIGAYFEKWRSGYQETLGAISMTEVVSGGHFPVSGGHFLA